MRINWNDFPRVGWDDDLWRSTRNLCHKTTHLPESGTDERIWLDSKPTRKMLLEMVSILDGMERLTSLAEKEMRDGSNATLSNWMTSLRGLQRRMTRSLDRVGVKCVPSLGRPFDAHLHEAVEVREVEGVLPATIVEVIEKPYRWGSRTLRVGKVVVTPRSSKMAPSPTE